MTAHPHTPSSPIPTRRALLLSASAAALLGITPTVHAGNTWDGGGGDDNWGTGNNWNPDGSPSPGSGNDLFFGGITRLSPFNNYTAFDDWRNITFNSGAGSFNLFGNAIDLFGKIENLSANSQTVGLLSIALNSATANEFNPVNGNLTINSTNIFTNGNQLKVFGNNGFTLSFSSGTNIQGLGSLAINQNSTVIFNSAHGYSGDTFVNAGKLQFNTGGTATATTIRIGDTTGAVNAEVGLIAATGGQTLTNTIVSRAGSSGTKTFDSQNTSGTNTLNGAIALDAPLTLRQSAGGTLNLSGSFMDVKQQILTVNSAGTVSISKPLQSSFAAGGSLLKQGNGTLILSNATNNYTGTNAATLHANGTQIAGGILGIHSDTALGLAPTGAYNNIQFTGSGTLQDTSSNISLHANRNVSIVGGATATLDSQGNTFTINGIINGAGNLATTASGSGSVVLTGNNTFSGTTTVGSGTLNAAAVGALGATTSVTVNTGGTLLLSGSGNRINNSAAVSLAGGTFNTAGLSETVGVLTLSSSSTIDLGSSLSILNFSNSSAATWLAGTLTISNWSGSTLGGGTDQLVFGSSAAALTSGQLSQVSFLNPLGFAAGTYSASILSSGELVPIPEPTGTLVGLALCGLAGWREQRRARRGHGSRVHSA